jgi:hypothetical protein
MEMIVHCTVLLSIETKGIFNLQHISILLQGLYHDNAFGNTCFQQYTYSKYFLPNKQSCFSSCKIYSKTKWVLKTHDRQYHTRSIDGVEDSVPQLV